jgi:hypothetical protein
VFSLGQSIEDGRAIPRDNGQISPAGCIGFPSPLLPFLKSSGVDAKSTGEICLGHARLQTEAAHIDRIGQWDAPHGEVQFALEMGEDFARAFFQFDTK